MRRRLQLPPILVVLVMEIALGLSVISRIDGTTVLGAQVGATPVSQVRSEDQNITYYLSVG